MSRAPLRQTTACRRAERPYPDKPSVYLKLSNSEACDKLRGRCMAGAAGELEIVQVARRIHPHGGVGGVAFALDQVFRAQGLAGLPITADTLGQPPRRSRAGRLGAAAEIVEFSWRATLAVRRARRRGAVVVVHGDALGGDIYVDHGLHKALVARRPWLLAHPLHLFIALREALRHRPGVRTRVACLSQDAEQALRRAYRTVPAARITRLANGVDLGRFRPDPQRLDAPCQPGRVRLAFVGHEFSRKGLGIALDALSRLPDAQLEVAGGRPRELVRARRRAARLGVAGRVAFHGPSTDVAALLRRSDLLLLPSIQEASPLVVLEAMASGAPVLASGVPQELLGEGGLRLPRSADALAGAVQDLTADGEAFTRLRWRAVAHARRFAWEVVAQDYIALAEAVRRDRSKAAA